MKHPRWILTALGATALLAGAAQASAAPNSDADFLNTVETAGIEYTNAQDAVAVGHSVCEYLYAGHGPDAAARALKISNRSISAKNAARFVVFAETAFCPDQLERGRK